MPPVRALLPTAFLLVACSHDGSTSPALPSFQDVSSAPAAIQTAAKAIVRTRTANDLATGAFLSATGLLMTNNHVLGTAICPVEGCYVALSFDYERGEAPEAPEILFAKPVAVSVGLDMALVQVYESDGGAKLETPSFLTLLPKDAASLLGANVTLVGHPLGDLKQWTTGQVYDSDGDWILTTAYILPGNSGSPMLDDEGRMVGIVHRGPTDQSLYAESSVDTYSIGTPSALLAAAMSAPLPEEMVSTRAETTAAAVVANDLVYLNAHAATYASAGHAPLSVLSALGTACDAALAVTDYATPDDLTTALQPCYDAMSWIECRTDEPASSLGTVCPSSPELAAWTQRFDGVNAATVALNGQVDDYAVSFAIAALSADIDAGYAAGAKSLVAALESASYPLDPDSAQYLAAFGIGSYAGTSLVTYVEGYAKIPEYDRQAGDLAYAIVNLEEATLLPSGEAASLLSALASDPTVDVGDKLYIESLQYQLGQID
jgi:V8-like Glu-specific endopeptidase